MKITIELDNEDEKVFVVSVVPTEDSMMTIDSMCDSLNQRYGSSCVIKIKEL